MTLGIPRQTVPTGTAQIVPGQMITLRHARNILAECHAKFTNSIYQA